MSTITREEISITFTQEEIRLLRDLLGAMSTNDWRKTEHKDETASRLYETFYSLSPDHGESSFDLHKILWPELFES